MDAEGTFVSEVYRNGRVYFFEASFSALNWSATIWDEDGRPHGSIACKSTAKRLSGEALEDAVCEWVHRAVQHEVGFLADSGLELGVVRDGRATFGHAANAADFGDRPTQAAPAGPPSTGFDALVMHHQAMHEQSELVMARFLAVTRDVRRKAAP